MVDRDEPQGSVGKYSPLGSSHLRYDAAPQDLSPAVPSASVAQWREAGYLTLQPLTSEVRPVCSLAIGYILHTHPISSGTRTDTFQ